MILHRLPGPGRENGNGTNPGTPWRKGQPVSWKKEAVPGDGLTFTVVGGTPLSRHLVSRGQIQGLLLANGDVEDVTEAGNIGVITMMIHQTNLARNNQQLIKCSESSHC